MTQYRTKTGDMIDAICHRYYGGSPGAVELVYEVNRNLADHGPVLPSGVVIDLPEIPVSETVKTIKLWD
ncbi:phage tail protein X [Methylobacter tundripaludum]|uniref:Phage tail protein X n=1 Tax=Methylobacter tundripaludum TaxID=173365 RepID=A0A2S6H5I9_9GAMM|nr:tail protein X [Methylobacter tundripaludum]PPK72691.1 phage tail protein X [Methylobacter tundripaludum]